MYDVLQIIEWEKKSDRGFWWWDGRVERGGSLPYTMNYPYVCKNIIFANSLDVSFFFSRFSSTFPLIWKWHNLLLFKNHILDIYLTAKRRLYGVDGNFYFFDEYVAIFYNTHSHTYICWLVYKHFWSEMSDKKNILHHHFDI